MTRTCTTCLHPERDAIDAALLAGQSPDGLARQYPPLSATAIRRHKADHLPATLALAQGARDVAHADDLLEQVRELRSRALTILDSAEKGGDLKAALAAIRETRGCIELFARLTHELADGQAVNIVISPEWQRVRATIVQALAPYPAAGAAVAERLLLLESAG